MSLYIPRIYSNKGNINQVINRYVMEFNLFIEKIANQFDDTDASEITADTEYQELDEWSSLTAMSIIAFVKTEMGKTITGREIRYAKTVKDLYNLIMAK